MDGRIVFVCKSCGRIRNAGARDKTGGCPCGEPWRGCDSINLDALLRVAERAREVAELVECPQGSDPLDRLDTALHELNKLNED